MPTYQYACTACDERLEVVQGFTDAALTECPACDGRLRKVFSAVGVVFKGSGFYKNDSREAVKSSTGKDGKDGKDGKGGGESGGSADKPAGDKAGAVKADSSSGDGGGGKTAPAASGAGPGVGGSSSGSAKATSSTPAGKPS